MPRSVTVQTPWKHPLPGKPEWHNMIGATGVRPLYAKGFVAGMRQFYPCPAIRVVDAETNAVIEEYGAQGRATVATSPTPEDPR
jgi:hypothetical protein